MSRYIDADKLMNDFYDTPEERKTWSKAWWLINHAPTADVRKNIKAQKVIGGGEHDGATCWFECSHCHGTVDINDAYCKHCGAVLEYQRGEQDDS